MEEMGHKLGSMIGSDVQRDAVLQEDVKQEQFFQLWGCDGIMEDALL